MQSIEIITDDTNLTTKTLELLDAHNLDYYVTHHSIPEAQDCMEYHGYKNTPVVILDSGITWNGYRPDLIVKHLVRDPALV